MLQGKMFAIHIIVLLTAFACHASAKTQIDGNNLTYECTNDDKIIIKGTTYYGSVYAEGTLTNGSQNSMCNVNKGTNDSLVIFTVSGCNVSLPVNITVMQAQQETSNDMVIGGKDVTMYQLKCNEIRLGGVNITATAESNAEDTLNVTKTHQKEVNLSMIIQNKANETLNSSSAVILGEELRLVISGNNGFSFLARSCIATDGLANLAHIKPLTHDGVTLDASLISNFSDYSDQNHDAIQASLSAFHFLNTNNVSIICTVTVCQDDDNSCPFQIQNNSGRRKRSAPIQHLTEILETSLSVLDSYTMVVHKTYDWTKSGASTGPMSQILPLILCAVFGFASIQP